MKTLTAVCFALQIAVAAFAAPDPWALLAERDLDAMRAQIVANHPGPVDERNPDFRRWLDGGHAEAVRLAKAAKTFGGYAYALRRYAAGFRDGHLSVGFTLAPTQIAWPGFLVEYRDGRYMVSAVASTSDENLPPVGSEIIDCNGRAPARAVEEDLWPYAMGPKLESAWPRVASELLIDRGNPAVVRPKSCRVRVGEEIRTVNLRYRNTMPETLAKLTSRATADAAPPVRRGGEGVWVSIPSFDGSNSANVERMKELVERAPEWRDAGFVVFDVRGNGGGNSAWGTRIIEALYGREFVRPLFRETFARQYVEWRVAPDNIAHVRAIADSNARQFGADSATAQYFQRLAEGMAAALERGESFFGDQRTGIAAVDRANVEPAFRGRVFLLTDNVCASACLDFADRVRLLPRFTHVGLTTSADSVYMEIRGVVLPSGAARLNLPVKVFRDRPRGHNEPYVPHHVWSGDIDDTAALERWIAEELLRRNHGTSR